MAEFIAKKEFAAKLSGARVKLITLKNKKGCAAQLTNYGARIVAFLVKDKDGQRRDIVIGHKNIKDYLNSGERYFNATVGRYANRIARGSFAIGKNKYKVTVNNGPNHLHGGLFGLNEVVWDILKVTKKSVKFACALPDGLDGYPADILITADYVLTEENALKIKYRALADKDTIVNITNHAFFNLGKNHKEDVLDTILEIAADKFTPTDKTSIPIGVLQTVKSTPFDFTKPKTIGRDIKVKNVQLKQARGYDHNFVLSNWRKGAEKSFFAARAFNPHTGVSLEVYTTACGLQLYTGNFLGSDVGKGGVRYAPYGAFCLEAQFFPDSPNKKHFPSPLLKAGSLYETEIIYQARAVKAAKKEVKKAVLANK